MSERLSVTVSDGLYALVEGISDYSHQTADVPALSKSRVFRLLARDGATHYVEGDLDLIGSETDEIDEDVLLDLVPKHVRARFMRDEIKDENWLAYMRGGFEDRVRDALTDVFASDFSPDEAAEVAAGFKKEARLYWEVLDDEPETLERKIAFVDERLAVYRERHETTTWDPDEEFLTGFEGVEAGIDQEIVADSAVEIAEDVADRLSRVGSTGDPDAIVASVAKKYGVDEDRVWDLVRAVRDGEGEALTAPDGVPVLGEGVGSGD